MESKLDGSREFDSSAFSTLRNSMLLSSSLALYPSLVCSSSVRSIRVLIQDLDTQLKDANIHCHDIRAREVKGRGDLNKLAELVVMEQNKILDLQTGQALWILIFHFFFKSWAMATSCEVFFSGPFVTSCFFNFIARTAPTHDVCAFGIPPIGARLRRFARVGAFSVVRDPGPPHDFRVLPFARGRAAGRARRRAKPRALIRPQEAKQQQQQQQGLLI